MCLFGKKSAGRERKTSYERKSKETQIEIPLLNLDGTGKADILTSMGFLDHMLTLFAYHGFFDVTLRAKGDTHVDKHHLNEDIGIALGEAFRKAIGDCKGIVRTASAIVPMDDARAVVAVDISNRSSFRYESAAGIGLFNDEDGYSLHYAKDLLESFAKKASINLHVEIYGVGDFHHYFEAVFKALGIALDKATRIDPRRAGEVPSSKGIL